MPIFDTPKHQYIILLNIFKSEIPIMNNNNKNMFEISVIDIRFNKQS